MTEQDAAMLIRTAIPNQDGTWADLGAGTGTFTRALATLLGPDGRVEAIERNANSRRELARLAGVTNGAATITATDGDFTKPLNLRDLSGILMANALHFVKHVDQAAVLRQLAIYLRPGGRIVLVEYEDEIGNQWVPYPVSFRRFDALCKASGLTPPALAGRMPSAFGGELYSAWTTVG